MATSASRRTKSRGNTGPTRKAGATKKKAARGRAKKPTTEQASARPKSSGRGKTSSSQRKKTAYKARRKSPKPSAGIAAEAIRIVEQAASILEEEISAGIVAAKKVEERYVNVNALRSGDSDQVMQRFRQDAHEVLDIVLDLVNLSINAMSGLGERAMNIRSTADEATRSARKDEENIAELVMPEVLRPGDSGSVGMLVENDSDLPTGEFTVVTSGLLGSSGAIIEPGNISCEPAKVNIGAHDVEKITINVSIPPDAPADDYFGLLHAPALNMRAMLTVRVQE